jgi:hypothetical protein
MDNVSTYVVRFDRATAADANRYADDLRQNLLRQLPDADVQRDRRDQESQDFGSSLVIILGTPTVVALARALHAWLTRNNAASLRIETKEGTLVAANLNSADAAAIAKAFQEHSDV